MTNGTVIVIDMVLSAFTAVLLLRAKSRLQGRLGLVEFLALGIATLGWTICDILIYLSGPVGTIRYAFCFRTAISAFVPVFMLLFVLRYYRLDRQIGHLRLLILMVPVITVVLALTNDRHGLLLNRGEAPGHAPVVLLNHTLGLWYFAHLFYSALLLATVVVILWRQSRRLPPDYRQPSLLMLMGTGGCILFSLPNIALWSWETFDVNLPGGVLAVALFYAGMGGGEPGSFLVLARQEIFQYLEDKIFVLNSQRRVMDANLAARNWLRELGIGEEAPGFDRITENLAPAPFVPGRPRDLPQEFDVYTAQVPRPTVYQMREQAVNGSDGEPLGLFVTLSDVTRYRSLIDRLEQSAGIDPLTGLGNRYSYERAQEELDRPDHLPLAMVVADVNRLKSVNDTLGHTAGDHLLQSCAQTMDAVMGQTGRVFRIGGDEFVCLLPRTDRQEALRLMDKLRRALRSTTDLSLPAPVTVALGLEVRERMEQSLEEVFERADFDMYRHKDHERRSGPLDRRNRTDSAAAPSAGQGRPVTATAAPPE